MIVIQVSTGIACGLTLAKKNLYEIITKKYKYQKKFEKAQQTTNSFDKLYRKCLQDNVTDKKKYDPLCNIFTNHVNEIKNYSLLQIKLYT